MHDAPGRLEKKELAKTVLKLLSCERGAGPPGSCGPMVCTSLSCVNWRVIGEVAHPFKEFRYSSLDDYPPLPGFWRHSKALHMSNEVCRSGIRSEPYQQAIVGSVTK